MVKLIYHDTSLKHIIIIIMIVYSKTIVTTEHLIHLTFNLQKNLS